MYSAWIMKCGTSISCLETLLFLYLPFKSELRVMAHPPFIERCGITTLKCSSAPSREGLVIRNCFSYRKDNQGSIEGKKKGETKKEEGREGEKEKGRPAVISLHWQSQGTLQPTLFFFFHIPFQFSLLTGKEE